MTHDASLPGGDFAIDGVGALRAKVAARYPWLDAAQTARLVQAYGTCVFMVLGEAASAADLGQHYGAGLYEAEIRYLCETEFAKTSEDILWRRSKLGLKMNAQEIQSVDDRMCQKAIA